MPPKLKNEMSQQSTATIDDYKKYVKELKLRIRQLSDKNKNLTDQLRGYETNTGQKMRQNILSQSIKMTEAPTWTTSRSCCLC